MTVRTHLAATGLAALSLGLASPDVQAKAASGASPAQISYEVTPETADHVFHVMVERNVRRGIEIWRLPTYLEGDPGPRNYGRLVRRVSALVDGKPQEIERLSPETWRIRSSRSGQLRIEYDVESDADDDLQLDGHWVDLNGGYFDPASLLLFLNKHEDEPAKIEIRLPASWHVGTALTGREGQYRAANYRELIDAPFLMGKLSERRLFVAGVEHELIFDGRIPAYDQQTFDRNISLIARYEMAFWDRRAPFRRYVALFRWRPDLQYGGGMEHHDEMLMNIGADWMEDLPGDFAGTFAHEYFHAWNAEAIHPMAKRARGNPVPSTDLLWFQEGVTSYYAVLTLVRTGIRPREQFLRSLSDAITQFESDGARGYTSLAESSRTAGSHTREQLDFYSGGEVVGFLLDMYIRSHAPNHSLDDVMRRLYKASAAPAYPGVTEGDIIAATRKASGADIHPLFHRLVHEHAPIDYEKLLAGTGLSVTHSRLANGTQSIRLSIRPDATCAQLQLIESWISGSFDRRPLCATPIYTRTG